MGLKRRLVQAVAIATVATGVVVPTGTQPARAAVDPATVGVVIQFAATAFSFFKSQQGGGLTLEQATQLIISEVRASRNTILNHMDALAVAEASACARHHVIEFEDIAEFSNSLKQRWAQDVTSCVTLIESLWNSVGQYNYAAQNQLAIALGAVGPIALIARAQAGFGTDTVKALLVNSFERARITFHPFCQGHPNVNEEFWLTYFDPIWLYGTFTCIGATDVGTSSFIGLASETGVGLFQGGALLQYDRQGVLFEDSSKRSAHGVAVAALAALRG